MTDPIITPDSVASARKRNIQLNRKIRVFFSADPDATMGLDGTIDYDVWDYVGMIASGSSLGKAPDITRNAIRAFGGDLIMNEIKFNNDVRTFSALEDNDTTFAIMNPGSVRPADGVAGVITAPEMDAEGLFIFEVTNSFGDRYFEVTRNPSYAHAAAGISRADEGASTVEITVEVPKGSDGHVYDCLTIKADGSGTPASVDPIRIVADAPVGP